ncbi:hypothetical protein [Tsukamurella asaccharolytica]|uniref:hypothetical protein n=1 Tax=Tsukamurella asaccharolytica TaxID=2592067 RepID=UPI001962050E|nr:hypothetical protein [Tsukamurella asaccharolytica]
MPRAHDRVPIALDRNPLVGLVPEPGKLPKLNPVDFVESVIKIITDNIERIPLIGPVVSGLAKLIGLTDDGALINLLKGLVSLDPRKFLDGLAGMFGGGAGLGLPAILSGLNGMFGGLRADGGLDASKLFGALPTGIMNAIRGLFSFLGGNVELGQLIRATPGLEKNWLPPFDTAESIKADDWWSWDGTVGRTKPGSAKCRLDGVEHVQTSDPIDVVPGQQLSLGGYLRWSNFTGTGGPAFILRVLAFDAGDQLVGSAQIGAVTPSVATSTNFETMVATSWTAPANAAYVRVRMECTAAATGGTVNWDDLWLRKPAQSLPQEWINGLVSKLSNLTSGIADAWNFAQSIIDTIMNGFGQFGSGFSLNHLLSQLGNIPQNAIAGLGGVLGGLLPKTDWTSFLNGFKAAGNNGTAPSTGSSLIDDVINSFLGVRTKAVTAQASAQAAVQTTGLTTSGTMGTLKWTRVVFATVGNATWTVPTPSAGYRLERVDVQIVGPGQGGPRIPLNYLGRADGGLAGGFRRQSFTPEEIGAPGTAYALTIPGGTSGATAIGPAAVPPRATVRRQSDNALLIQSPEPGTSGIVTTAGIPSTYQAPGSGGANGPAVYTGNDSNGNSTYSYTDGEPGDPSFESPGGTAGRSATGWFGSGSAAPGNGANAPTSDPYHRYCGSGGGGCAGRVNAPGGAGGDPGGGGGVGSPHNGAAFLPSSTNGGPGGRAEIVFWIVEAPL